MNADQIILLLKRIKRSIDGPEFIEYLNQLSKDNYQAFKRNPAEMNEFHKGYAFAIDSLITSFEQCELPETIIPEDIGAEHY